MEMRALRLTVAAAAALLLGAIPAAAAPGDPDTSFGAGGRQTLDLGGFDRPFAMAIAPDGKIVLAGFSGTGTALARFEPSGTPDASFGTGGFVIVPGPVDGYEQALGVAITPDGRLRVSGVFDPDGEFGPLGMDFIVRAFAADGSVETGFGDGGSTLIDFGGGIEFGEDIALTDDGRIVVGGTTSAVPNSRNIAVARLTAEGNLDTGFGDAGKKVVDFGTYEEANDMALDRQGRIVLAGRSVPGVSDFAVARLTAEGQPDPSFGAGGIRVVDSGAPIDTGNAVAIGPDGRIVSAGSTSSGPVPNNFGAFALTDAGLPDPGFNGGAVQVVNGGGNGETATGVAIAPDSKVVIGGSAGAVGNGDFGVARLLANGLPDPGFAAGSISTADFGGNEMAQAAAIAPDGGIVVAGFTDGITADFALAKFQGDPVSVETVIDSGPGQGQEVNDPEATFTFSSPSDGIVGFECSLDDADFAACDTPHVASDLSEDRHTFAVRAINNIQTRDTTPATRNFVADPQVGLAIKGKRLRLNRRDIARARIRCPESEISGPCRGKVKLKTRKKVRAGGKRRKVALAKGTFKVKPGKTGTVKLKLSEAKAELVGAKPAARKVRLVANVRDRAANKAKVAKKMKLAPAGKRG